MALSDYESEFERGTMHSHDKTLLSKLGFLDEDRKNPSHDMACLYVCQRETLDRLAAKMFPKIVESWPASYDHKPSSLKIVAKPEFHLRKGEGQYATTIGFLDAFLVFILEVNELATVGGEPCLRRWEYQWGGFIEVKIGRPNIGDLLRQMNLYKTYVKLLPNQNRGVSACVPRGLLVAPWDVSPVEKDALSEAGFGFMKLGESFSKWKQEQSVSNESEEI